MREINGTKTRLFEKTDKTDKPLARLITKRKESSTPGMKGQDSRPYREHYESTYANNHTT